MENEKKPNSPKVEQNRRGNAEKKDARFYVMVTVGVAVVGLLAALVVILLTREPQVIVHEQIIMPQPLAEGPGIGGYDRRPGGRGFVVTEDNVHEVLAELERLELDPADRHFEFSLTAEWTFPTSLTPSPDARVQNVERNSRTVFFDVYIEDIGVVYVSPYMPLGSEHNNFALEVELEPGVYDATLTYFLVDDDLEILTDISVGVTITVES